MSLFIGKHVGGWWLLFVSYKGARYNDVNEVMHIEGEQWKSVDVALRDA